MNHNKKPYIFVTGNEKGGAGKTTCSMHLIVGLLDKGYKVSSIDADARQHSLTSYINNRQRYNEANLDHQVDMPKHFHLSEVLHNAIDEKNKLEQEQFTQTLVQASNEADYIVIDTPGSHTNFSRVAHSYADTVITPINDSFIDLDVMAKVNGDNLNISQPSIYSQMLWEQKMARAERDNGSIHWVVMRNRLSNLDAINKRNVADALQKLAKRISFKIAPGFSERVIFRELFPVGLTLLDLTKANFNKNLSISHVAARQELRDFLNILGVK
ncbi:MAG: division plane positioning ATPase MipZ [Rickettsiaceae bacterium]